MVIMIFVGSYITVATHCFFISLHLWQLWCELTSIILILCIAVRVAKHFTFDKFIAIDSLLSEEVIIPSIFSVPCLIVIKFDDFIRLTRAVSLDELNDLLPWP